MDINLDEYRLDESLRVEGKASPKRKVSRKRKSGWYFRGPIPGDWLTLACGLPGRTLNVALYVRHQSNLSRTAQFRIERKGLNRFGIGRSSLFRGLERLEAAGLIRVTRGRGRRPLVEICDYTTTEGEGG